MWGFDYVNIIYLVPVAPRMYECVRVSQALFMAFQKVLKWEKEEKEAKWLPVSALYRQRFLMRYE